MASSTTLLHRGLESLEQWGQVIFSLKIHQRNGISHYCAHTFPLLHTRLTSHSCFIFSKFTLSCKAVEQRVEMYVLVLVAIALCFLFKILNVNNSPEKSQFYCSNQKFLEEFLKRAPELAEPYIPTRFWGFSGHLQTIIQVRYLQQG